VNSFKAPKKWLGGLDADSAGKLITAAADVALIVDRKGVIRDVAFGSDELVPMRSGGQVGWRLVTE